MEPDPKFIVPGGAFYGSNFGATYKVWENQVSTRPHNGARFYATEDEYFVALKHTEQIDMLVV
jgi:hypothetical protein